MAQLCGIQEDLGVKGKSGHLASMRDAGRRLSDSTHRAFIAYYHRTSHSHLWLPLQRTSCSFLDFRGISTKLYLSYWCRCLSVYFQRLFANFRQAVQEPTDHVCEVTSTGIPPGESQEVSAFFSLYSCTFHGSPLSLVLFFLEALPSGLARPRHAGWDVIARAIFAFLFLEHRIIHMHVILYRGQIFVSQQLL